MAKLQILDQFKGFLGKLSLTQKIIMFGAVAAVIIFIFLIFSMSKPNNEYSVLFSSLESGDASKIVQKLKESKIEYQLADNGSTILVDKTKVYETRLSLAGEGLPESGTVGYEIFDKTNLGMSEFVQKLNYRRALEGELSRTIGSIDEIKKARVHIVIPERALFDKDQKKTSASVTLHLKSGRSTDKIDIAGIQNLVASSVEGMSTKDVVVVDQKGNILSKKPTDDGTLAGLTSQQYEQQKNVENYLSSKVQSMLDGVLGGGNSEVRVNAELDFTQIEKTVTDFDPEKQVTRSEQSISENSQSIDSLSYPTVSMSKNQSNQISNYEIPKTVERIIKEVGNIKRLSVAALINGTTKVVDKNGQKVIQYIPRTDEEMQKLTDIVKNAVGYDQLRNDQISVINVPFDNTYLEEELKESLPKNWWENNENIKLLLLVAAILIAIFLMYRLLHSKQIKEKIRIAYALPENGMISADDLSGSEKVDLDDIMLDDDDLMLLPAELPDQLLLEGSSPERHLAKTDGFNQQFPNASMVEYRGESIEAPELSSLGEEAIMKLEIKRKIKEYMEANTLEAVKLLRSMIHSDIEEKISKN
ncbi:MAG: flagellar basal-body MS-ring/collar protein FliF [Candidatus Kapabacteria bacterium]|nr:flagellar basal-body MS-ring/collar protein FliF [Candidatus Kapabacteria bacterium]